MARPVVNFRAIKMDAALYTSVIIPTYNRKSWLLQTLDSLTHQTMSASSFEVIVVDDGSDDGTSAITSKRFPFSLRYVQQPNQGDAAARNLGVEQSRADILVFLDDDILAAPNYLACLVQEQCSQPNRIIVGKEVLWLEETNPVDLDQIPAATDDGKLVKIPFTDIRSNNMSVRRLAYDTIGRMQGLAFAGSSMWCDVDFAYRAHQQGFEFYQSTRAVCWHRDHVAYSMDSKIRRMKEVGYRAVPLFQKYPDLLHHLSMFDDKAPVALGQESLRLTARKALRGLASSRPALASMKQIYALLDASGWEGELTRSLERWIIGGYIYRGFREGLREFSMHSGIRNG